MLVKSVAAHLVRLVRRGVGFVVDLLLAGLGLGGLVLVLLILGLLLGGFGVLDVSRLLVVVLVQVFVVGVIRLLHLGRVGVGRVLGLFCLLLLLFLGRRLLFSLLVLLGVLGVLLVVTAVAQILSQDDVKTANG